MQYCNILMYSYTAYFNCVLDGMKSDSGIALTLYLFSEIVHKISFTIQILYREIITALNPV